MTVSLVEKAYWLSSGKIDSQAIAGKHFRGELLAERLHQLGGTEGREGGYPCPSFLLPWQQKAWGQKHEWAGCPTWRGGCSINPGEAQRRQDAQPQRPLARSGLSPPWEKGDPISRHHQT